MKFKPLFLFALTLVLLTPAFSQTAVLLPSPIQQFFNVNGVPLSSGSLAFYASGTFTAQAVFADAGGVNQLTNPISLNAGGYPQNGSGATTPVFLTPGIAYRVVAKDVNGVQQWLVDNVTGLASSAATLSSVVPFASTMTFNACANNQLFFVTLTGNVNSSSFNECPGVQLPAFVTFELIQDGTGNRTFSFPANSFGGGALNTAPNVTTIQTFLWDGTTLQALNPSMGAGVFFPPSVETPIIEMGPGAAFFQLGSNPLIMSGFAPDVFFGSGWGTGKTLIASNGTAAFRINVGTGGTASTGTISFAKPATTGWNCSATDITNPAGNLTRQSGSTTSSASFTNYNTSGVATAWPASDTLSVICFAL